MYSHVVSHHAAFGWAKKQMPDVPLSLLGKMFKLRQVGTKKQQQRQLVSDYVVDLTLVSNNWAQLCSSKYHTAVQTR